MRRSTKPVQSRHTDAGQAVVEFTLMVSTIVLLLLSVLDFMMVVYTYSVMADSAKEGVRYAVAHGCDAGAANCSGPGCTAACTDAAGNNVVAAVNNYAKLCAHNISGMTVTVTYPDSYATPPNRVRVVINYPYPSFFTLGWKGPRINAAAEGRISY